MPLSDLMPTLVGFLEKPDSMRYGRSTIDSLRAIAKEATAVAERLEMAEQKGECVWGAVHNDEEWHWDTACGQQFGPDNMDTLEDNGYRFCPYCGKPIKEAPDGK
jgi:hypothetical protein